MESTDARRLAGVAPHVDACIEWLRAQRVYVNGWGMPNPDPLPPDVTITGDLLPCFCLPKRQREWWRALGARRAAALADLVPHLASQGGPEGGAWLNANKGDSDVVFADDEFMVALRLRLRLPVCAPTQCGHVTVDQTRCCRVTLDADGHRAMT